MVPRSLKDWSHPVFVVVAISTGIRAGVGSGIRAGVGGAGVGGGAGGGGAGGRGVGGVGGGGGGGRNTGGGVGGGGAGPPAKGSKTSGTAGAGGCPKNEGKKALVGIGWIGPCTGKIGADCSTTTGAGVGGGGGFSTSRFKSGKSISSTASSTGSPLVRFTAATKKEIVKSF
jgi:hypothetical protein